MSNTDYVMYQQIMQTYTSKIPCANFYIYLDTTPALCLLRVRNRSRPGEDKVTLKYLTELHVAMKTYSSFLPRRCFNVNANQPVEEVGEAVYQIIRDHSPSVDPLAPRIEPGK